MNGRVYDYNMGRFMSVDPLIHSEGGSQGINPYSYMMNNPMAGTDPTGYDPKDEATEDVKSVTVNITATTEDGTEHIIATATVDSNGAVTINDMDGNELDSYSIGSEENKNTSSNNFSQAASHTDFDSDYDNPGGEISREEVADKFEGPIVDREARDEDLEREEMRGSNEKGVWENMKEHPLEGILAVGGVAGAAVACTTGVLCVPAGAGAALAVDDFVSKGILGNEQSFTASAISVGLKSAGISDDMAKSIGNHTIGVLGIAFTGYKGIVEVAVKGSVKKRDFVAAEMEVLATANFLKGVAL